MTSQTPSQALPVCPNVKLFTIQNVVCQVGDANFTKKHH